MEMKKCNVCGRSLPLNEFKKHFLSKDGYSNLCRTCASRKRMNKDNFTPPI